MANMFRLSIKLPNEITNLAITFQWVFYLFYRKKTQEMTNYCKEFDFDFDFDQSISLVP